MTGIALGERFFYSLNVGAELINPLELVGGYGHIKYASGGFNPNRIFYETTVDVEKV